MSRAPRVFPLRPVSRVISHPDKVHARNPGARAQGHGGRSTTAPIASPRRLRQRGGRRHLLGLIIHADIAKPASFRPTSPGRGVEDAALCPSQSQLVMHLQIPTKTPSKTEGLLPSGCHCRDESVRTASSFPPSTSCRSPPLLKFDPPWRSPRPLVSVVPGQLANSPIGPASRSDNRQGAFRGGGRKSHPPQPPPHRAT